MNKKRPVNLDFTTLKFPPMAIISILHRLSGVFLFLIIPVMLCGLSASLGSKEGFDRLMQCFSSPWCKGLTWFIVSALFYHLIAGVRHLLMDLGFGEDVKTGRTSAILVLILAILTSISLGVWLW